MTTTAAISSQSIGTSTNVGEGKFGQKITAQATTSAFVVTPRVTNGAAGYDPANEIVVRYTSSSFSLTMSAATIAALAPTARFVSVKPAREGGGVVIKDSSLEPITGGYIYLWCDIPTVAVAQTLDVNLVEVP